MQKIKLNAEGLAINAGVIHVYHVDPKTQEFIRESDEHLSEGVGIPAHSYIDEPPPSKTGFAVCRGVDSWEFVEDHRGETVYSTQTQATIEIVDLGPLPSDATPLEPGTVFDIWDGKRWVTDEAAKRQAEIDAAETEKKRLLVVASAAITTLADAVEFDMATPAERQRYDEWRRYRVLLTRVDTAAVPVSWPPSPAE